jgi:hypothetical protein
LVLNLLWQRCGAPRTAQKKCALDRAFALIEGHPRDHLRTRHSGSTIRDGRRLGWAGKLRLLRTGLLEGVVDCLSYLVDSQAEGSDDGISETATKTQVDDEGSGEIGEQLEEEVRVNRIFAEVDVARECRGEMGIGEDEEL